MEALLNIRGRIIIGTQEGTIILTTNHIPGHLSQGPLPKCFDGMTFAIG